MRLMNPARCAILAKRLYCRVYNACRQSRAARACVLKEFILAYVTLRDGEDPEALLKRFQTSMQRSGILRELRNRRFFRSKGEQTRLDKQRSLRRIRRRRNR